MKNYLLLYLFFSYVYIQIYLNKIRYSSEVNVNHFHTYVPLYLNTVKALKLDEIMVKYAPKPLLKLLISDLSHRFFSKGYRDCGAI